MRSLITATARLPLAHATSQKPQDSPNGLWRARQTRAQWKKDKIFRALKKGSINPHDARLPASQHTREELTALIEGRLSTASAKDELIKLASCLIIEEALELGPN